MTYIRLDAPLWRAHDDCAGQACSNRLCLCGSWNRKGVVVYLQQQQQQQQQAKSRWGEGELVVLVWRLR